MDRDFWEQLLAMAEKHVIEGERHILRQRELVGRLMLGSSDEIIASAKQLLAHFEDLQILHVADRDRLRSKLAKNLRLKNT
jgi:hypothetical protein